MYTQVWPTGESVRILRLSYGLMLTSPVLSDGKCFETVRFVAQGVPPTVCLSEHDLESVHTSAAKTRIWLSGQEEKQ